MKPGERDYNHFLNFMFQADATLTFPQTLVLRYTLQEPNTADKVVSDYTKWYIARLKLLNHHLSDGREFRVAIDWYVVLYCVCAFLGYDAKDNERDVHLGSIQTRCFSIFKTMMSRPLGQLHKELRIIACFDLPCE